MKQIISTERIPIKLWLDDIEDGALKQAKNLANLPFTHKHVVALPDTHSGYGMMIGGVIATQGYVIVNAVGKDISCGVIARKTNKNTSEIDAETLKQIMGNIRLLIPVGLNGKHKDPQPEDLMPRVELSVSEAPILTREYNNARKSIGTLGSGNHFLELQKDPEGYLWVMIHSGSRNLGSKVADHYNNIAKKLNEKYFSSVLPNQELAFLPVDTEDAQNYFNEMKYCMAFAQANRNRMMTLVCQVFDDIFKGDIQFEDPINIAHNYAKYENHFGNNYIIHRKGATSAREGEIGIIPGSQGTKSFIVRGKGNPDSFNSCFAAKTKILTDKGLFFIEDVYDNTNDHKLLSYSHADKTFSHETIIEKSERVSGVKMYDVFQRNPRKNNSIVCTNNHPFASFENSDFSYKPISLIEKEGSPVIVPLKVNINKETSCYDEDFYYLLGTILSDGTMYVNGKVKCGNYKNKQYFTKMKYVRFQQVDTAEKQEYIGYVKSIFDKYFTTIYFYKHKGRVSNFKKEERKIIGKDYVTITGKDDIVFDKIAAYLQNDLFLSILSSDSIATNFLAGYLDGDGTETNTKLAISITKETKSFDFLIAAFLRLGVVYKIYPNRLNYTIEFYDPNLIERLKLLCKRITFNKVYQKGVYTEKNVLAKTLLNPAKTDYIVQKSKKNQLVGLGKITETIDSNFIHNRVSENGEARDKQRVFNFTLAKNNNYIVFTKNYTPLLVHNCSHGAGRTMSRTRAKNELNLKEEIKKLDDQGIIHGIRSVKDLEEAVSAYKDISVVMKNQQDLVEIITELTPLGSIKG
jgi:tRNA-splicing ligase RtcB